MNSYESKKQGRIERLKAAAERRRNEAKSAYNSASTMAEAIPFGQPILVGHHSEKRDRNYRERIDNKFHKAFEAEKQAKELEQRAASAENNNAISSDNPEAVDLLKEKLARLEKNQELFKRINAIIRKKITDQEKISLLVADSELKLNAEKASKLLLPDFAGRVGIASYVLTNNNGNMARIRDRIKALESRQGIESSEKLIGKVRIVQNTDDNRLQLFFPGKPSETYRDKLKHNGFHWSHFNGAWQRQLNNSAIYYGEILANAYNETEGGNNEK